MEIYVVKPGDNVDNIAAAFGVDVDQIIYDNQLEYPYELAVGQALLINEYERNADRAISVSGYAYPFISPWILEQTLPYSRHRVNDEKAHKRYSSQVSELEKQTRQRQ